jgi:hypothetical protein
VALSRNPGFGAIELRDIEKIIIENQRHLLEAIIKKHRFKELAIK